MISVDRTTRRTAPLISDTAQRAPFEATASAADASSPDFSVHPDASALLAFISGKLEDDQAQEMVVIDLNGKSSIADALVIASGRSQRHVGAMADHLTRGLKENGFGRAQVEGMPQADWVLIDAGDVIVHLFRPEVRSFYNIEKIWSVETPGHLRDSSTAV